MLYSGRGTAYSLALEGTLKLKKPSYIHVEGYPAGELKRGLIARIDDAMPVIIIAPRDAVFAKTVSNMQEVAARGGRIVLIGEKHGAEEATAASEHFLPMPDWAPISRRSSTPPAIQLLAPHIRHGQRCQPAT